MMHFRLTTYPTLILCNSCHIQRISFLFFNQLNIHSRSSIVLLQLFPSPIHQIYPHVRYSLTFRLREAAKDSISQAQQHAQTRIRTTVALCVVFAFVEWNGSYTFNIYSYKSKEWKNRIHANASNEETSYGNTQSSKSMWNIKYLLQYEYNHVFFFFNVCIFPENWTDGGCGS